MADENTFHKFIRAYAAKLREDDGAPGSLGEWNRRQKALRERLHAAIGPFPKEACDLAPRVLGTLERDGYRIEKLVFQSQPDLWVTATAYFTAINDGQKMPAVLVVHGHWAGARRDPVVQARCLGLAKLGFFVLAVDAFGSGERFTKPARGTYHGALYGSTLWPTGHTLLGMQVHDNRRAVDYLLTRKEVNGKIGITGASGGGNQSMYAGALDDRLAAVVPVCSVGTYQSYLQTACCVCEVLPGALTFTEEGDVLGLVAPRALLVMNASRDGIQFSPGESAKSVARAKDIYTLLGEQAKVGHRIFESGHDYNRPMREAMYGWMTLHLKGEGKGDPIPEPEHAIEKPEDLACFPNPDDRPKGFVTPPLLANKLGRELVASADKLAPTHAEMWDANARQILAQVVTVLSSIPVPEKAVAEYGSGPVEGGRLPCTVRGEAGELRGNFSFKERREKLAGCLIIHLDGEEAARGHAIVPAMIEKGYSVLTVDLRTTGPAKPKTGAIAGAPDHNPAEYGVWVGRSLLSQWVCDALTWLKLLREHPGGSKEDVIVGIGHGSAVAILAAALLGDRPPTVILAGAFPTYVTDAPYSTGTPMGILAPGILKAGDSPHFAALIAPRRLIIAGSTTLQGKKLNQKELEEAFHFTAGVYRACKAADRLTIAADPDWNRILS